MMCFIFFGISQTHKGLEAEINMNLSDKISMSGMVSLGDWVYTNNINLEVRFSMHLVISLQIHQTRLKYYMLKIT